MNTNKLEDAIKVAEDIEENIGYGNFYKKYTQTADNVILQAARALQRIKEICDE